MSLIKFNSGPIMLHRAPSLPAPSFSPARGPGHTSHDKYKMHILRSVILMQENRPWNSNARFVTHVSDIGYSVTPIYIQGNKSRTGKVRRFKSYTH